MKSKLRSIKEANIVKRVFAMIMDGVIFAFVWGCLAAWVMSPIANSAFKYEETTNTAVRYQTFSKLYVLEATKDKETQIVDIKDYTKIPADSNISVKFLYEYENKEPDFYLSRIKYYYLSYKTNQNIEYPEDLTDENIKKTFYSPEYDKEIILEDGSKVKPRDYYTESWFNEKFGGLTDVLKIRQAAADAATDLFKSNFYTEINNKLKGCQLFITIPPFLLSYCAFYILVPLLYKNGETFGKKVCHVGFVTKDCYDIKKRQMVFRQILLLLWISLSLFIIGIGMTSIGTLGVGVFIYLIATLISKTHRSPIDYAAYTYLIDTGKSVWFHDPKEEEKKEEELEKKMEKYQAQKVENKNLIQVGTTIVNEDVKKEFEEEKLKSKKSKKQ